MFGEMAVIDQKPRSACAVARPTDFPLFHSEPGIAGELIARCPSLALALLREISLRLREFNRQHVREVLQSERLAIIGRFARSIVHDLKNPLNIISNYC
jgi:signal transduction histidine kinase